MKPGTTTLSLVKAGFALRGDKFTHWCERQQRDRSYVRRVLLGQVGGLEARKLFALAVDESGARQLAALKQEV